MDDAAYSRVSDEELINRLDSGALLEAFEKDEKWKMFKEACKRVHDKADKNLTNCDPRESMLINRYQLEKKFYENVVVAVVESLRQDRKAAFEQAKDRGLVKSFIHWALSDREATS